MSTTAVLLMDLQVDFLDAARGRMPVGEPAASEVLAAANAVASGAALGGCIVVAVANEFPASQTVLNHFRHGAAIAGSDGARVDPRLMLPPGVRVFLKSESSAFSNPELHPFLRAHGVRRVVLLGVFAEGCIRMTALAARRLGYEVVAPLDAIATNGRLKRAFALRSMRRHGVQIPPRLAELEASA